MTMLECVKAQKLCECVCGVCVAKLYEVYLRGSKKKKDVWDARLIPQRFLSPLSAKCEFYERSSFYGGDTSWVRSG
jgi:hypothetical protein